MFLHVLADTLGSVGVIVSSCMISWFGWVYADAICTMFIAGMILLSIVPLFKNTVSILMQRLPSELDSLLYDAFQKVCSPFLTFVCCANGFFAHSFFELRTSLVTPNFTPGSFVQTES